MKHPTLQKIGLTTIALLASLALSAQAGKPAKPTTTSGNNQNHSILLSPRDVKAPPKPQLPQEILYDQYDNISGTATLSATFTDFATFNADLADDFVVPSGESWTVESIDADGIYFNGAGPADSWNVFIYTDAGGLPGGLVASQMGLPATVVGSTFTVNFAPSVALTGGTYWIEIQANMTFATEGEWGWTDRTVQSNSPAAWQNPAGGFGLCPSWTNKLVCVPTAGGPDQVYRINGTTGNGTPTPTPTPTATPSCTPMVVNGSIDTSDPTQIDRLFRSGIPQTCPASTSCSIFGDPTPHHYDQYTFTNTSGATQCVTIDTNTACADTNFIFTAAYTGSFDPNNICTNWIGDSGSSPAPDASFQVDVDAGQTLVVVVSEVTPDAGCSAYTVTVTGLCGGGGGGITLTAKVRVVHGDRRVALSWTPADGGEVNILRDGAVIRTTADDGRASDRLGSGPREVHTYQVCETDTGTCSNEVKVKVPGSGQ
jgi:hypothetical protein